MFSSSQKTQKLYRRASRTWRSPNAGSSPKIRMKSPLVMFETGLANFGVSVTLLASIRVSRRRVPPSGKLRISEKSRFHPPGPVN